MEPLFSYIDGREEEAIGRGLYYSDVEGLNKERHVGTIRGFTRKHGMRYVVLDDGHKINLLGFSFYKVGGPDPVISSS